MFEAWGKTDRRDGGHIHPLAHHCMDVAAVFARMTELPVIRNRLETAAGGPLKESVLWRLAALVFLHDIGKLHPGFQSKGWLPELWRGPPCGHLKEGWDFLNLAFWKPEHPFHRTMKEVVNWGGEAAILSLLGAAIAHHGRPVEAPHSPALRDWPRLPHYDWRAEARRLDEAMRRWFPQAFERGGAPLPDRHRFHHAVAGLAALADWIGSDTRFFPFSAPFDPAYDRVARKAAIRALETIGLDSCALSERPAPDFAALSGFPTPNPAQVAAANAGLDDRLTILEAETGSGKTEAALWRFVRLFAAGKVSGLYFAVPTRAAARQIHGRVVRAMQRVFGDGAPEAVLAIPGMLRAGDFQGQRLPDWNVRWDDEEGSPPQRWAAEHATRFLAATVAVGTVDQALLAGLQVKHAHLRGGGLIRSLLVIDEVHASDSYMAEILKTLLDGHIAVGGYAMLMSATLGARARAKWTDAAEPSFESAKTVPYPAVWVSGEDRPRTAGRSGRSKTVRLDIVPTMEAAETAKRAIEAARLGARVLAIRNTVSKAVDTWRAVRDSGGEHLLLRAAGRPALHHGRFAVEDRALLDEVIEAALAPVPARERRGCIAIGTQTLEQSLDIDADFLISDLCPMDVLLQRIGRLHRHALPRPEGFEAARALVLAPRGGLDRLTAPAFDNGLGAWEAEGGFNGIYLDLAGLELTRRLIAERSCWRIPEMNRELVEGATHPDRVLALLAEKGEDWSRYDRRFGGVEAAAKTVAQLVELKRDTPFHELQFPDSDERIMTRLGEEGAILSLDPPPVGPFGRSITRIAILPRWSGRIADNDGVDISKNDSGLVLAVADRRFEYAITGLRPVAPSP